MSDSFPEQIHKWTVTPRNYHDISDYDDASLELQDNVTTRPRCESRINAIQYHIYLLCTCLSIIVCLVATVVYFVIKDKIFSHVQKKGDRVRHWINWNFMISFILRDLVILVLLTFALSGRRFQPHAIGTIFITYLIIANFYWMFAEGLWLYLGIFRATRRVAYRCVKFKMCLLGWVLPGVLVSMWAITEAVLVAVELSKKPSNASHAFVYNFQEPPGLVFIVAPVYLLLLINFGMMVRLLIKLSGILQCRPRRRLAKAILALVFLLGIPFLIPIILLHILNPQRGQSELCAIYVIQCINNILSALQGVFVAFYCAFTNKEVRRTSRQISTSFGTLVPSFKPVRTSSPKTSKV